MKHPTSTLFQKPMGHSWPALRPSQLIRSEANSLLDVRGPLEVALWLQSLGLAAYILRSRASESGANGRAERTDERKRSEAKGRRVCGTFGRKDLKRRTSLEVRFQLFFGDLQSIVVKALKGSSFPPKDAPLESLPGPSKGCP